MPNLTLVAAVKDAAVKLVGRVGFGIPTVHGQIAFPQPLLPAVKLVSDLTPAFTRFPF